MEFHVYETRESIRARQREAAFITFMVTASGFTLLLINSAFWGLVAGIVANIILN
jgi:benzoate membrane transport protein